MPGDVVDIEVWVKYIDDDPQNWTPLLNNLIAAISIPSGGIFIDGGQPGSLGNETLPFIPLDNDSEPGVAPKAYLNYIIMDRDFNKIVNAGAKPVTTAAREYGQNGEHERLFFDDIVVREAGYMYIYLSNEGDELVDVFFDDLKVTHTKSPVIEAQDFMPFGLTFNQYTRESAVPNRWKFQGQEHIDDLGLNWDSFKWRNHQPDIGRFFNVDPLAEDYYYNSPYAFSENKVTTHIELEGLEAVNAAFLLEQAVKVANTIVNFVSGSENAGTPEAAAKFGTAMNKAEPISAKAQEMKAEIEGTLGQVPGMNVALNVMDAGQAETTAETLEQLGEAAIDANSIPVFGGRPTKTGTPSLKQQALDIKTNLNGGRNSVTIGTPNKQIRYDLDGIPHGKVETPHKQVYKKNIVDGQVKSITKTKVNKDAVPMTQAEIRTVKEYLLRITAK